MFSRLKIGGEWGSEWLLLSKSTSKVVLEQEEGKGLSVAMVVGVEMKAGEVAVVIHKPLQGHPQNQ